jgi:small subunit ribosomal protein S4e
MARGPKKHLKRVRAPKAWLMNKMGGVFTVKPNAGPHKARESIPLQVILRDKLKFALTGREADVILHQKEGLIRVDKKIRRDPKYPVGFMDVIDIPKVGVSYRVLYDVKGRYVFTKVNKTEAAFKLCRITRKEMGPNKIAYLVTHDGRTIRFADKSIHINDTIKYNLETKEIIESFPMAIGSLAMVSDGSNTGRVGTVVHISKLDGNFDLVTLKDSRGHTFTTRINYVFVIGKNEKPAISLPRGDGIKYSIQEETEHRLQQE